MEAAIIYLRSFFQVLKITDIIDICLIAVIMYQLLKVLKETRAMQLVKGIVILFLVLQISSWAHLTTLNYLLRNAMQVGMFAIVVIFQPVLRSLLEKLGRSKAGKVIDMVSGNSSEQDYAAAEIVRAAHNLSETKTGALIVIERETKLGDVIRTGTIIDAEVSAALLENIFFPKTPLHDGAVIIRNGLIHAAACYLPKPQHEAVINKELGTRHRSAIGMSEISDAIVIVVSEETGVISVAENGKLDRNYSGKTLRARLTEELLPEKPKQEKKSSKKKNGGADKK